MKVTLKSITPDAEVNIVEIARVSSSRTDKSEKPEGLINYLINNKHWSPFQHSYLTFEIVTSKAIGIQLLRHLSFTFQEFSQRYSTVENVEPIEFRMQADKNRQSSTDVVDLHDIELEGDDVGSFGCNESLGDVVDMVMNDIQLAYKLLLKYGIARECARFILPMASETTIFMTGSVRSWIHFLDIRLDGHAQKEAQLIAQEIKKIFIKELPIISAAREYKEDTNGNP